MTVPTKNSLKTLLAVSLLCITFANTDAKKVTTRFKAPAEDTSNRFAGLKKYPHHTTEFERVSENLTFMAYDKKASSDKETFFVDNGSSVALDIIEVEISYFNSDGSLIHRRSVELQQNFPAKETRKVDIASWDKQKSFHYINSVPSAKGSTPYTVRFKILSFLESPE